MAMSREEQKWMNAGMFDVWDYSSNQDWKKGLYRARGKNKPDIDKTHAKTHRHLFSFSSVHSNERCVCWEEAFVQRAHRDLSCTHCGGRGRLRTESSRSSFLSLRTTVLQHTPHLPNPRPISAGPHALTRDIPHSHGLVQTGWHHQILGGVELGAHHVVIVAGQHTVDDKRGNISAGGWCLRWGWGETAVNVTRQHAETVGYYQTHVLDCQFQIRMVWSSEALRIQGYS